jgi:hypothetical protein
LQVTASANALNMRAVRPASTITDSSNGNYEVVTPPHTLADYF